MARKKGKAKGMVNLSHDTNGKREGGTFKKLDKAASATKLGSKTTSSGFKEGGAISGAASTPTLAKRARGGRTGQPFSAAGMSSQRAGGSTSGHEGE